MGPKSQYRRTETHDISCGPGNFPEPDRLYDVVVKFTPEERTATIHVISIERGKPPNIVLDTYC